MKLQESKFNVLLEYSLNRYQLGGFLTGQTVIIKPKYGKPTTSTLDHPELVDRGQTFKDLIASCIESKTPLRVSDIKSIRQDIPGRPHNSGASDYYIDVMQEYAPGLYHNVMTLPGELLEVQEHGINLPPAAGMRRQSKNSKAEEHEHENSLGTYPKDSSTPKVNTKLPNANKWPNEPGGRKSQKY